MAGVTFLAAERMGLVVLGSSSPLTVAAVVGLSCFVGGMISKQLGLAGVIGGFGL